MVGCSKLFDMVRRFVIFQGQDMSMFWLFEGMPKMRIAVVGYILVALWAHLQDCRLLV